MLQLDLQSNTYHKLSTCVCLCDWLASRLSACTKTKTFLLLLLELVNELAFQPTVARLSSSVSCPVSECDCFIEGTVAVIMPALSEVIRSQCLHFALSPLLLSASSDLQTDCLLRPTRLQFVSCARRSHRHKWLSRV